MTPSSPSSSRALTHHPPLFGFLGVIGPSREKSYYKPFTLIHARYTSGATCAHMGGSAWRVNMDLLLIERLQGYVRFGNESQQANIDEASTGDWV